MELEIENLSQKHGLMLVTEDPDFLHCCMKCEVAESLGSIDACPQRVHTSNSCCPSCSIFLEHGLEAMLLHWKEGQFFASFQIVIPLKIDEDMIRRSDPGVAVKSSRWDPDFIGRLAVLKRELGPAATAEGPHRIF